MDEAYREAVREMVKPKFGRKKALTAIYIQKEPVSAQREYMRFAREVDNTVMNVIKEALPEIKKICDRRYDETHRYDSQADDIEKIQKIFQKALNKVSTKRFDATLQNRISQLANLNRKLTVKEWKRVVKNTLGIDIFEDYYNGEKYQKLVDKWISENVDLVKSIPKKSLSELEKTVMDGWYNSRSTKTIMKDIQNTFHVSKNKARLLAIDQTSKLNAELTKAQQTDAGIEEYIWSSSGDARVREGHRKLHGKTFRWDDPPIVDEKSGRRCHPGEDYQCRCIAIPKFNIEALNIPVKPVDWNEVDERTRKILEMS